MLHQHLSGAVERNDIQWRNDIRSNNIRIDMAPNPGPTLDPNPGPTLDPNPGPTLDPNPGPTPLI